MQGTLAIVGATGMLARPLVRRLQREGHRVVCLVRDAERARQLLPAGVETRAADLRDQQAVTDGLRGCDAVYTNLCQPFSRRAWDPDLEGTRTLIAACKAAGVGRYLRISALGCPEWRSRWWVIENKARADDAVRESGLRWTIFKPTWLMESLPLYIMGPMVVAPPSPDVPLWWLAADDYGRQVIAALGSDAAQDREFIMQGPEAVTMRQAIRRFRDAFRPRMPIAPMLGPALRLAAALGSRPRYLRDVLAFTWGTDKGFIASETWATLGEPRMTIEDYAASIPITGDLPRK